MNEVQLHTLIKEARRFVEEGKFLHAVQLYRRLIESEPSFNESYVQLSIIFAEWGHFEQAEQVLLKGYQNNPAKPELLLRLGDLQLRQQQFPQAISYYRRLRNQRMPQAHFNLGIAYMGVGNLDRAEEEVRLAILSDPAFPRGREVLGDILIRREAYTEAIKELKRGLRHEHYSGSGHRLLGIALSRVNEWSKAYDEFALAIDMDPQDAAGWQLCGDALLQLGRHAEAEAYLQKAITLKPELADAFASFGFLYLGRGDKAKARESFERALKIDPAHPRAMQGQLRLSLQTKHTS
jgi:tetratricopeptide (TPR) repeat protein